VSPEKREVIWGGRKMRTHISRRPRGPGSGSSFKEPAPSKESERGRDRGGGANRRAPTGRVRFQRAKHKGDGDAAKGENAALATERGGFLLYEGECLLGGILWTKGEVKLSFRTS